VRQGVEIDDRACTEGGRDRAGSAVRTGRLNPGDQVVALMLTGSVMTRQTNIYRETRYASTIWHADRPQNSLLETNFVAPRKGAIQKFLRRLPMSSAQRAADIAAAPDRAVMRNYIFPEVAKRGGHILFVGVRAYTADYPAIFEQHGGMCWTMDIDPEAADFGVPNRHVTGSVTRVHELLDLIKFRTIVLTGVLGFGVNRFSDQLKALESCAAAIEPGGTLILGWNDRRVHASLLEEAAARWFDFRGFGHLPSRIWVTGYDHNFAFLKRREGYG